LHILGVKVYIYNRSWSKVYGDLGKTLIFFSPSGL
jgi:hypothetical protein